MPKCLHPPCPNQVADALYCDEHKYIPHWTTNVTVEAPARSSGNWQSYDQGPLEHRKAPFWLPFLVLILLLFIIGLIVILKLIF